MIRSLCDPGRWTQLWYVDDASASGSLPELCNWFNLLCSHGPSFGYYPEPTKSFVIVNEQWMGEAAAIFGDLGVQVVTGHRFLGGFIGSCSERDEYVMSKVCRWVEHVDVLTKAALTQPQLAYAVFSRSLQHEWTFLLLFCYVLFCSASCFFRILSCHCFLIFCQPCLVLRCLQLNDICLCN